MPSKELTCQSEGLSEHEMSNTNSLNGIHRGGLIGSGVWMESVGHGFGGVGMPRMNKRVVDIAFHFPVESIELERQLSKDDIGDYKLTQENAAKIHGPDDRIKDCQWLER